MSRTRAQAFIDTVLRHAASKYYDPVKAHEYYMRTRELKGRQSGAGLNENQKKAFSYSKAQISEVQKAETEAAAADRRAEVEAIRQAATERRIEIRDKLAAILNRLSEGRKEISEEISADRQAELDEISGRLKEKLKGISNKQAENLRKIAERRREALAEINEDAQSKIDAIPPVPKGVSKEKAAELAAERSAKISGIRDDASKAKQDAAERFDEERDSVREAAQNEKDQARDEASDERESVNTRAAVERTAVSNETAKQKGAEREASNSEREQVAAQMKEAISGAQTRYDELKQTLKAKYEGEIDSEYEAIKTTVR